MVVIGMEDCCECSSIYDVISHESCRELTKPFVHLTEARTVVVAAVETAVSLLIVAVVDGDVSIDEISEEDHELGRRLRLLDGHWCSDIQNRNGDILRSALRSGHGVRGRLGGLCRRKLFRHDSSSGLGLGPKGVCEDVETLDPARLEGGIREVGSHARRGKEAEVGAAVETRIREGTEADGVCGVGEDGVVEVLEPVWRRVSGLGAIGRIEGEDVHS